MLSKKGKPTGFTLPELLVVLLLLALLYLMALPTLQHSWQAVALDGAAQQIHRDLRWAQQIAVREQKTVAISFFSGQTIPIAMWVRISGNCPICAAGRCRTG